MNRKTIIIQAVFMVILVIVISIVLTLYLSRLQAEEQELNRLELYAQQITNRVTKHLYESSNILKKLATQQFESCSKEHIAKMQEAVLNSRVIGEIDYFENDRVKCNSWGLVSDEIRKKHGDVFNDDVEVIVDDKTPLSSRAQIGIHYKNYKAYIDPIYFDDSVTDPEIKITLKLLNDKLIAKLNDSSTVNAFSKPVQNDLVYIRNNPLYKVIVSESQNKLQESQLLKLRTIAPVAGLASFALIGIVIWISRKQLSPLGELQYAIKHREFEVHYQPLMEMTSGKCIGAEALIRWHRTDGTWERPDVFIQLAEENNLIDPITDQMVAMVFSDLKTLFVDRQFHVSINFTANDFETGRIIKILEKNRAGKDILSSQIWFEATERGLMDKKKVLQTMEYLNKQGYPIVIDDFGTGYSNLSYLQKFPIDTIKIDKSFVDAVAMGAVTSSVTEHIIKLGKSLKLKLVAEGIEKTYQADYLKEHGVDYGQGWLYAKAMPLKQFIEFYKQSQS